MNLQEKAAVVEYHRKRLGMSPEEAVGWRTVDTQVRRFEALCRWGLLTDCSVLDLGCGLGELLPYLLERFGHVNYCGVDLLAEFIVDAQSRFREVPHARFVRMDFLTAPLPTADVVLASGSLNYRCANPRHPLDAIERMWNAARTGVAFNLLDARYQSRDGLLQSYHAAEIWEFCKGFDPCAELVTGYHPEDFTILMRR